MECDLSTRCTRGRESQLLDTVRCNRAAQDRSVDNLVQLLSAGLSSLSACATLEAFDLSRLNNHVSLRRNDAIHVVGEAMRPRRAIPCSSLQRDATRRSSPFTNF